MADLFFVFYSKRLQKKGKRGYDEFSLQSKHHNSKLHSMTHLWVDPSLSHHLIRTRMLCNAFLSLWCPRLPVWLGNVKLRGECWWWRQELIVSPSLKLLIQENLISKADCLWRDKLIVLCAAFQPVWNIFF